MYRNERPLIFLLVTIVSSSLVGLQSISIFTVYASGSSPYESGRDRGDAGISDPDDRYINQPEKGPSFHTEEFMAGYYDGFDSCGGGGGGGFSQPEPDSQFSQPNQGLSGGQDFGERYYEGWNWRQICSQVDDFLSDSCNDLVTSDGNALTAEGKAAQA